MPLPEPDLSALDPGFVEAIIARYAAWELNTGTVAEFLGIHYTDAQHLLGSRGLERHYTVEDLEQDLATAHRLDALRQSAKDKPA
ncbi:MAG: hypothetical protein RLZZ387_3298 [Chloroflexota bacterium]